MRYWVTPFQLSATALSTLNAAGLQPWPAEGWSALPDAECLLLYDSPDRLIAMVGSGPETEGLTAQSLLQGYRRLLDWSERPGQPLLAISQLQRLGPGALRSWFDDGDDAFPSPASPLPIPPLLASVCLSLLVDEPALLDCYHDLELRAALLGRDPDLRYRERLLQAGQQGNAQLQTLLASQRLQAASSELEKRLASRDAELREAREASEQTLQELHQVQGALERSVHADADKQRQLEAGVRELEELQRSKAELESAHDLAKEAQQREHDQDKAAQQREHDQEQAVQESVHIQELEALRQRLEPRVAELEQRLASRDAELREAREASEQTLQELHQVQGALERSVHADADKQRQLEAGVRDREALRRSKADQESNYEQAKAAQQRAHDQELEALRQQLQPRLADLEQRLASRDTELREARETVELTLLQFYKVQEELEHYFLADAEKQQQLEAGIRALEELRRSKADQENNYEQAKAAEQRAHVQELEALRQQLEPRLVELEQRLSHRDAELRQAKESAEMSLLQHHQQVQDERKRHSMAVGVMQRQLEAAVRDMEQLRLIKTDQESGHELARAELEQRLASRDTELREAREAAEMTLLQLHQQVYEEREVHSMAVAENQRQLEAGVRDLEELRRSKAAQESAHELAKAAQERGHQRELEALRLQLEPRLAELEHCLASRDTELRQEREAAEMTMQQLHQVQEELEHYFLKARASDQLAQAQLEQLQRAQSLLVRLKPDVLPNAPYTAALAVEVLPELPAAMPDPSLQTQALLSTYAASLQRASALLERARRS